MVQCFEFLTERRIILCLPVQLLSIHCLPKLEALTLPLQVLNIKMYQEANNVSVRKEKSTNSPQTCFFKSLA